jgi:hypothetical protein
LNGSRTRARGRSRARPGSRRVRRLVGNVKNFPDAPDWRRTVESSLNRPRHVSKRRQT